MVPHSGPPALTWQQQLILIAPMLLFSMVAHEYAHGWAALEQGDETALALGRLTWNPLKHIDPFMTIIAAGDAGRRRCADPRGREAGAGQSRQLPQPAAG